ncbi:MAG: isoprenyl transferase [Actinobacteria bacterium]|nr:isoprenyl transferase [Actinomycetota bacterium]
MVLDRLFGLRKKPERLSEDFLLGEIKSRPVPRHVAIITDGNGRWARQRGLPRLAGHREGTKVVRRIVEAAPEIGVDHLTFYAFSTENWQRPGDEIEGLLRLIEEQLEREVSELNEKGVRIMSIGRAAGLPESLRNAFAQAAERTAENKRLTLIIALNYGGRAEITDAAARIASLAAAGKVAPDSVDEKMIASQLYTAEIPDPELLIRTSGERRVSNFLLWQIAYSEIWVTEKLWPDFTRRDFFEAVYDFQSRRRRFGGLEED